MVSEQENQLCRLGQKVVESIYMSKVRYGLQLMGKIRWTEEDTRQGIFKELQKTQNKLLRFLNKSKISDKIPQSVILEKLNMLSINQLNAKIKLTKMWKADNSLNYSMVIKKSQPKDDMRGVLNLRVFC